MNDLTGWDFTGQNIANAGFELTFSKEQLYSTASYEAKQLHGLRLWQMDLTGWDFSGQDLTNASFAWSKLSNANFTAAVVRGMSFDDATGFTKEQLYSTSSYQARQLPGIGFAANNLSSWDLSGQDLSTANLDGTRLRNANLSTAKLNFADLSNANLSGANLTGAVLKGAYLLGGTQYESGGR